MSTLYYKYGNYTHPVGEVKFNEGGIRREYDERGFLKSLTYSHKITGFLQASTPALLTVAANQLKAAYNRQGQNAGLYDTGGVKTTHYLDSATALGGVRVVDGPTFTDADAAYTTFLPYTITLEATYLATVSNTLEFKETISVDGTGEERWGYILTLYGPPVRQTFNRRTTVQVVQSGFAVGLSGKPNFPRPIFPQYEHKERRRQQKVGPDNYYGAYKDFGIQWSYYFEMPQVIDADPHRG